MSVVKSVASDTNILRHPAPRRYLTVIEEMRGRRVVILPTVDFEAKVEVPDHAYEYRERLARKSGKTTEAEGNRVAKAAWDAAFQWWDEERDRNDSAYLFVEKLKDDAYADAYQELPKEAFEINKPNDRNILAEAKTHGYDVLASRNFKSIDRSVLERHFAAKGIPQPVMIRNLSEHTAAIAMMEGREVSEVAVEVMLAAVIPNDWTPERTNDVMRYCEGFMNAIAGSSGRDQMALNRMMTDGIENLSTNSFTQLCEKTYANRPVIARDTEMRYHRKVNKAVEMTGIALG